MDEEYKNRQKAIASDVEIFASQFGTKYPETPKNLGTPEKNLGTPEKNLGNPEKSLENPKNLGNPEKNLENPKTPIVEKKLATPNVSQKTKPKKKKQQKPVYTYDSDNGYDNGYDIDDKYLDMEDKYA
jgi:hypothetical protein